VAPIDETPELVIVASGVLVVDAPTPLQVIWLVALAAVLMVVPRLRDFGLGGLGGPRGGGGGGLRLPRPPTRMV
jgi:hypothetical protein